MSKKLTSEEELKELEEMDNLKIQWARENGRSEEYLKDFAQRLKQSREELFKGGR